MMVRSKKFVSWLRSSHLDSKKWTPPATKSNKHLQSFNPTNQSQKTWSSNPRSVTRWEEDVIGEEEEKDIIKLEKENH